MNNNLLLKAEHIYKTFPDTRNRGIRSLFSHNKVSGKEALKDINIALERGKSLGIMGHNGSGKSTFLRILSGITQPTKGSISIYGRHVSIIELGSGFHPDLSGRENIYFAAQLMGVTRSEITAKIEKIIDFSEIRDNIDQPVKYYSSGMYLRLAFALIIHVDAELFLLDEFLSVGDLNFKSKCFETITDLRREGRSFILASHNFQEVRMISDDMLILENGLVDYYGVVDQGLNRYTKDLNLHPFEYYEGDNDQFIQVLSLSTERPSAPEVAETIFRYDEPINIRLQYQMSQRSKYLPSSRQQSSYPQRSLTRLRAQQ